MAVQTYITNKDTSYYRWGNTGYPPFEQLPLEEVDKVPKGTIVEIEESYGTHNVGDKIYACEANMQDGGGVYGYLLSDLSKYERTYLTGALPSKPTNKSVQNNPSNKTNILLYSISGLVALFVVYKIYKSWKK